MDRGMKRERARGGKETIIYLPAKYEIKYTFTDEQELHCQPRWYITPCLVRTGRGVDDGIAGLFLTCQPQDIEHLATALILSEHNLQIHQIFTFSNLIMTVFGFIWGQSLQQHCSGMKLIWPLNCILETTPWNEMNNRYTGMNITRTGIHSCMILVW